jgi:hypothetical protein
MGKWTEQTILKRITNGQQIYEEIPHIPGRKGNANQNHIEIPLHSSQNGYHQERKQQQMLLRMQEKRSSYTLLVGM